MKYATSYDIRRRYYLILEFVLFVLAATSLIAASAVMSYGGGM